MRAGFGVPLYVDADAFDSSRQQLDGATINKQLIDASTARLDFRPGSETRRLEKLAGRVLGRCLGLEEPVTVQSIRDVDRLDDRAGADDGTIAVHVARWRERFDLPPAS